MTTIARLLAILAIVLPLGAGAQTGNAGAQPVPAPAATPAVAPTVAPAPAGAGMAIPPAASPDTTVGGGAANRSVPAPQPMPSGPGSATGSLLQTLFALILVLAVLGALAWFLKRYGPKVTGGSANLRIVGSLNLGGRERLLVVEVGGQWIVVGASPGRVNVLATMPRQDSEQAGAVLAEHGAAAPASSFGDWLKQTIDKRH